MKLPDASYYQDRPVPHTAQGDLYVDVPSPVALGQTKSRARGARKRPLSFLKPEPTSAGLFGPKQPLVVVCNYTCGFMAQPPGTEGYSHGLRQVAPVVPLSELISSRGMQRTEVRRLKDSGFLAGLLYVPKPPAYTQPFGVAEDEEFGRDDYAVLLYAVTTVDQSVLDESTRVARLAMEAQKLLIAGLISLVGPSLYDPKDLEDPDMSCSWP